MRFVITGGTGFVGQWLARALLVAGNELTVFSSGGAGPEILTERERSAIRWVHGDIRDASAIRSALHQSRPEAIIHLAGISFVPAAESDPLLAYDVNVLGAVRLLTEVAAAAGTIDPTILIVGSGTQYGVHDASEMPLTESSAQRPTNVYAATKAAQEIAVLQLARSRNLRVICTRSFSHSGRGHAREFLLPSLALRAVAARSTGEPIRIGNDVSRDYLHIDDVVEAYLSLIRSGRPHEVYNVCSGRAVTVSQLARMALDAASTDAHVESDPGLARAGDMPLLVGSCEKLQAATGWQPKRSVRDIFEDLLAG